MATTADYVKLYREAEERHECLKATLDAFALEIDPLAIRIYDVYAANRDLKRFLESQLNFQE